jgi:hypothetical protein
MQCIQTFSKIKLSKAIVLADFFYQKTQGTALFYLADTCGFPESAHFIVLDMFLNTRGVLHCNISRFLKMRTRLYEDITRS